MREALRTNVAFSKNAAVHPKGIWNSSSPSIHPSLNVFGIWDYPVCQGVRLEIKDVLERQREAESSNSWE